MNRRFNIINTVTCSIDCTLESMLEFMLSRVTKTKSNSYNIFDSDSVMAIKKTIRRRPYEF